MNSKDEIDNLRAAMGTLPSQNNSSELKDSIRECLICGREYMSIGKHIRTHNITVEKYIKKYYKLICNCGCNKEVVKKNYRMSDLLKKHYIVGHVCHNKLKSSNSMKNAWKKGLFKNRKQTKEHKKWVLNDESKKNISNGMKKLYKDVNYKKYWMKNNLEKNLNKIFNVKTKTKLEIEVEKILKRFNAKYIFNYRIENKFFDFKIDNLNVLIEVDGEYWHNKDVVVKNDIYKNNLAEKHCFKIYRIKESELKNIKNVENKIFNILKNG